MSDDSLKLSETEVANAGSAPQLVVESGLHVTRDVAEAVFSIKELLCAEAEAVMDASASVSKDCERITYSILVLM